MQMQMREIVRKVAFCPFQITVDSIDYLTVRGIEVQFLINDIIINIIVINTIVINTIVIITIIIKNIIINIIIITKLIKQVNQDSTLDLHISGVRLQANILGT